MKLNQLLMQKFEAIMFGELHWKIDIIREIEKLILNPSKAEDHFADSGEDQHFIRNFFYLKCTGSIDEILANLLYTQSDRLWRKLEPIESSRGPQRCALLKIHSSTCTQMNEKSGLRGETYGQLIPGQSTQQLKSHEFYNMPTQNYYDFKSNQLKTTQALKNNPEENRGPVYYS